MDSHTEPHTTRHASTARSTDTLSTRTLPCTRMDGYRWIDKGGPVARRAHRWCPRHAPHRAPVEQTRVVCAARPRLELRVTHAARSRQIYELAPLPAKPLIAASSSMSRTRCSSLLSAGGGLQKVAQIM